MLRPSWKSTCTTLATVSIITVLWYPLLSVIASREGLPSNQYIEPFLYAPYPGTSMENAIFDHSSPDYSQTDNRLVTYSGDQAAKLCPVSAPPGATPPQPGVCDLGSGIYWSYGMGDWLYYNGHDGIDYGLQYSPIYASAETDQVDYAGWHDPMDHTYGMGLYIRLHHPNGFGTTYGHLSSVAVQSCPAAGCAGLSQGALIGYSGNTGNSTGPHLHFRVTDPFNKPVDPYGWIGENADPWPYNQHNSLWVQDPSVVPYFGSTASVLPTGGIPLDYPAAMTDGVLVDDSGPGFSESPAGCWTRSTTKPSQSENGSMHYTRPILAGPATCTAYWKFPAGQPAGSYAAYIHIPSAHATSEGALYTIFHAGRSESTSVNQSVFPNPYHAEDGWLYIGSYQFSADGNEFISLANLTLDSPNTFQARELAADAARFVSNLPPTPTVTPSPTHSANPVFQVTATRFPTITRMPGGSPTP